MGKVVGKWVRWGGWVKWWGTGKVWDQDVGDPKNGSKQTPKTETQ